MDLGRRTARRLAAATTGLTFTLILLGVYTAASGAGLACSAQWPLCDGGVLPQTLPSFIEWFHRLVAMVAGFAIFGTAVAVWRTYEARRIRLAAVGALAVTPVQVLLGRQTVVQYTPTVQTAHHGAAMLIFGGLLATTLWAYERPLDPAEEPTERETTGTTPASARTGARSDD
jgi:cytochrome c oxidase assembly protein subunit 15